MKTYQDRTFDEERALYALKSSVVRKCAFKGPKDGESALKECEDISVQDCLFDLRYPLWHLKKGRIENSVFTKDCRAALWYDRDIEINGCQMNGIKAVRECDHTVIKNCSVHSVEFGWFCRNIRICDSSLESEYPFLKSENIEINALKMNAKYSFQYVKNLKIKNAVLTTKDAFWHAQNAVIEDSIITGEYLGWYSENLTFIRCKIAGTQPLCYAKNLTLQECEMTDTDLAFEYSDVHADIRGSILSVKNPKSGEIIADHISEILFDENKMPDTDCKVVCRKKTSGF